MVDKNYLLLISNNNPLFVDYEYFLRYIDVLLLSDKVFLEVEEYNTKSKFEAYFLIFFYSLY